LSCFLKGSESWLARMSSGSEFHVAGPACEKAHSPNLVRSRGKMPFLGRFSCPSTILFTDIYRDRQDRQTFIASR